MPDAQDGPRSAPRILVAEDDPGMRSLLLDELRDRGYQVYEAINQADAVERSAACQPDLILADLRLPDGDAMEILRHARGMPVPPAFMILTAFGSVSGAVEALKAGADDFITKPVDLDHLHVRIERILDVHNLKGLMRSYKASVQSPTFHGIVARSPIMHRLFDEVRQLAQAQGPVLIVGESGVGKERIARAVHAEGETADGPFVPVNCAAIPESLVESELFGHTSGAFTGAQQARRGLFEEATGGTLLLDEITELPLGVQAKLLRVLQEGDVRRVGENQTRSVDVRVLAATNRDIHQEMKEGRVREDLYYRLETFTLRVPPLRERGEDIEYLAVHFLSRYRLALGKVVEGFTEEALAALRAYSFPGNVRELENVIERAVTFASGRDIDVVDLGPRIAEAKRRGDGASAVLSDLASSDDLPSFEEVKRRYVRLVLDRVGGNKRRAAKVLGIGRQTLYRYLDAEV
ncbi:MAG: sigma-54-dependent transcriptional regulator [Myxococcota bacterium]